MKKRRERVADIKRCVHFVIATRISKPSHSNSKKHSQQYIVYVFMKKWGIIKIRKRISMLFCLGPFIVILLKLSVATRLEYRAKGVQQLSKLKNRAVAGPPARFQTVNSEPLRNNPKQFTSYFQKATTVFVVSCS